MVPPSSIATPEIEPVSTSPTVAEISPLPTAADVSRSIRSPVWYSVPSLEIVTDEIISVIVINHYEKLF